MPAEQCLQVKQALTLGQATGRLPASSLLAKAASERPVLKLQACVTNHREGHASQTRCCRAAAFPKLARVRHQVCRKWAVQQRWLLLLLRLW
jgi:hypothetical protein